MEIIRQREFRQVRWRNGRGQTAEIAASPDGAGPDAFLWRISMAEVAEDGPFSVFPGIDRVLTLISGEGLTLEVDGRTVSVVDTPLAFAGDVPCRAHLGAGPITDLNVMTRRGRCRAVVRRDAADPLPGAIERLVFATGPVEGRVGDRHVALEPRDVLRLAVGAAMHVQLTGRWLDIQIHAGGPE